MKLFTKVPEMNLHASNRVYVVVSTSEVAPKVYCTKNALDQILLRYFH